MEPVTKSECMINAQSIAVLSDAHVGADNCILDGPYGYDRLRAFLRANDVRVGTFILLGDIFELALSTYERAATSAHRLLSVLCEFCDEIVYVPGNHDHHLWQMVSEEMRIVKAFPHLEAAIPHAERSYSHSFLGRILNDGTPSRTRFIVSYPNAYWQPPHSDKGVYVFHHGHFCQEVYRALSDIFTSAFDVPTPGPEELESINAGWLELVWYHLGQAGGGVGGIIEKLNDQLGRGESTQLQAALGKLYERRLGKQVTNLMLAWSKESHVPKFVACWIADQIGKRAPKILARMLEGQIRDPSRTDGRHERGASAWRRRPIDDDLAANVWAYIEHLRRANRLLRQQNAAFVFGHTHVGGVWPDHGSPHIFNDGAWILHNDGQWPSANVFVCDATGRLTVLPFEEHATGPTERPRSYDFAPVRHAPAHIDLR